MNSANVNVYGLARHCAGHSALHLRSQFYGRAGCYACTSVRDSSCAVAKLPLQRVTVYECCTICREVSCNMVSSKLFKQQAITNAGRQGGLFDKQRPYCHIVQIASALDTFQGGSSLVWLQGAVSFCGEADQACAWHTQGTEMPWCVCANYRSI